MPKALPLEIYVDRNSFRSERASKWTGMNSGLRSLAYVVQRTFSRIALALGISFECSGCREIRLSPLDKEAMDAVATYQPFYKLDNHGHVRDLHFENQVADSMAIDAIATLAQLKGLMIHAAKITDDDLAKLSRLTELEGLGLKGTPITDKGLIHLEKLENLRWIWLGGCSGLTNEGIDKLDQALPDLVIYR